jgi:LacI family transcriptional regulator
MRQALPTLEDVARRAGVSTATVSRCFNAPERVVANTRDRVMRVVQELGYTPHFGGRALASNRTNTVGAIIPTMENAIFARGVQAFQEGLAEAGVTLLVASSGYNPEQEFEQIRTLIGRGADGLLLIGEARSREAYDFLERRRIPYIITWNYRAGDGPSFVGFDNRQAARRMTEKVLHYGHRNLAAIAGITSGNDRAADRLAGVHDALAKGPRDARLSAVHESPYSLEGGAEAFAELMRHADPPTAVVCGNDVLAAGANMQARALGLHVPQQVSITGFDDIDLALAVQPQLTTVHVPHRRMGHAAANLLLDLCSGKAVRHSIQFETVIVERGSLAKAPES